MTNEELAQQIHNLIITKKWKDHMVSLILMQAIHNNSHIKDPSERATFTLNELTSKLEVLLAEYKAEKAADK